MTEWIFSSSILICAIIALRALFKKRISPSLRYGLWLLVLIRLLLPINLGNSSISVMNHIPSYGVHLIKPISPLVEGAELPFTPYEIQSEAGTSDTPSTEISDKSFDFARLALYIYLSGAGVFLAFFVFSNLHFARKLKNSRVETGRFSGLNVYRSDILNTPCLFGFLSPAIYLSTDVELDGEKHVLMHEYAHFRQGDHVWSILRCLALVLHWYNPLVWLAVRLSKQDGELSCDEKVLNSMSESERTSYGRTLISLSSSSKISLLCSVVPLSSKGKTLKERIEYIAKRPKLLFGNMLFVLVLGLIAAGCTFTGAEKEKLMETSVEETASPNEISIVDVNETAIPFAGQLLDRNGKVLTEDNSFLYQAAISSFDSYLSSGSTVKLSIDLELQKKAQSILKENLSMMGASGFSGCAVALDVKSGAPIAIIGMGEAVNPLEISFSPGQLFLPCTGITALGEGLVDADYKIKCEGVFKRYEEEGYAPQCWIHRDTGLNHPDENMESALRDSCEFYFYALGNDCGIDALENYAHMLGLGVPSGIELPSSNGLMPGREAAKSYGMSWNIGHTIETAVGRSLSSFTPLQLAQYCSTIANNGTRYSASIVDQIIDINGNIVYEHKPVILNQINTLKADDWSVVKSGLFLDKAFAENSAWKICGKSSTINGNYLYNQNLFMGYAPSNDPEIAVAVVTITASDTGPAAQIAAEIMDAYRISK